MNAGSKKGIAVILLLLCLLAFPEEVKAGDYVQELMEELDFDEVDASFEEGVMQDNRAFGNKLHFTDLVKAFAQGQADGVDAHKICSYVFDQFFYEVSAARSVFIEITVMAFLFAIFGKLLVVRQGYVSDMGFFVVYTAIVLLLLQSFALIEEVVDQGIGRMISFMSAFIPTYAATLLLSGNTASAGFFYEVAFGMIYLLELAIRYVLVPGVQIYVLLAMMDHLFEEPRFLKLAELIKSIVCGILKFGMTAVVGLGVVQSLVTPARDRLAGSSLYHGLGAIPGIGNTFGATAELLLGCALMIKNSVGAAALVVLLLVMAAPLCGVLSLTLMYRLSAALLEPFCDRRIVECVASIGNAAAIYGKILWDTMLCFLITVSMVSASTSFIY